MDKDNQAPRIVLGWREWVGLPELALPPLRAKVDTGARTSSLHVERHWRFTEQGVPMVGFELRPRRTTQRLVQAALPLCDERTVSDSGGHRTLRPFVLATIEVGGRVQQVEINLADRAGMLFPLLLGRSALHGFAVDPTQSFLHPKPGTLPPRTA